MRLLPESGPGQAFLRLVALGLVFLLAGYLFSVHFGRTFEAIKAKGEIYDPGGLLGQAQREFLRGFGRSVKERYGFEFRVRVQAGMGVDSEQVQDPRLLLLAVDPAARQVRIVLPPLAARALGEGYVERLEREKFEGRWESGEWPTAMSEALIDIWEKLRSVENNGGQGN